MKALVGLIYALRRRKGLVLLTGEAGTGKTTILRTIAESLSQAAAHFRSRCTQP
jgi:MoxR-like ATPase